MSIFCFFYLLHTYFCLKTEKIRALARATLRKFVKENQKGKYCSIFYTKMIFNIYLCLVLFIAPVLGFSQTRFGARYSLNLKVSPDEEELREAADFEVRLYLVINSYFYLSKCN